MYYFYVKIRQKSRVVEYAIYSMDEDGAVNDCENVVTLNKEDSIEYYIRKNYGRLLGDHLEKFRLK